MAYKGTYLKTYKNAQIYVTTEGKFYCDVINNSDYLTDNTHYSNELLKLEKDIDNYQNEKPIAKDTYEIGYFTEFCKYIKELNALITQTNLEIEGIRDTHFKDFKL